MSLTFVLGKSQKDHQNEIFKKFINDYKNNSKDKFFFIVPNHIKFESEISIIKKFKKEFKPKANYIATNNLQVFSLSRLAWYFLRDTNYINKNTLTETKKSMIIRYILNNMIDQLDIFRGEFKVKGFIDEIIKQIEEFQDGNIKPSDLDNIAENFEDKFEIKKLNEIKLIYQNYLEFVENKYLNSNYLNEKLTTLFNEDSNMNNYHFYLYGFSSFKLSEYSLINSIILNSDITISLDLDKPYVELPEKTDFYYRPSRTYQRLYQFARSVNVNIINKYAVNDRVNEDLQSLEDYWIDSNSSKQHFENKNISDSSVQIWQASNRQSEVQAVATYIRQLIATQGYRFNDFLILSRDLSLYESFLKPIFNESEVPIFFDLQNNMSQHPLKLLVDYLFDFFNSNFEHESIFQLLKLNLLIPNDIEYNSFQEAIDLAENYSLAKGLNKNEWLSENEFVSNLENNSSKETKINDEFKKINLIKDFVKKIYTELSSIVKNSKSNIDAISDLYNFLTVNNVFKSLSHWQESDIKKGNINKSNIPNQVVNTFNNILDEFIETFGGQMFQISDFLNVLDSGFETSKYSQIPSTLDAVNVSELGMVQMNNRKITVILGSTSDMMPKTIIDNSLLSDDEKEKFSKYLNKNSEFSDSYQVINNDEPYLHNNSFISSTERVIFSYPVMSANNQEQVSPYIKRIKDHFNLNERIINNSPNPNDEHALEYVGSKKSTFNYLIRLNRSIKDSNLKLSNNWQIIQNIILDDSNLENKMINALNYQNLPVNLKPEIAEKIYGDNLNVSISQLETFYKNEYEYFLKYGLKIYPRDEFELTFADIGSFFHENLDYFSKYIVENKINISQLSFNDINNLTNDIMKNVLNEPQNKVFSATSQMNYITGQLYDTIKNLIISIKEQSNLLSFEPMNSELMFGRIGSNRGISGLEFNINDKKVKVRGKIDRVDKFSSNDALQIIDYKSSKKKFDYSMFNSGLQLQLTTYIKAIMNDYKNRNIVGAFYSHIYNPVDNASFIMKENDKKYQMTGIIVDNGKNIGLLSSNGLDKNNSSDIYKLRINKNGKASSSEIITDSELDLLLEYNEQLIKNAAKKIFTGKISLNPFRSNDQSNGLEYSDYKPIFEFDAMLPENNYRDIPSMSKIDLLNKIRESRGELND